MLSKGLKNSILYTTYRGEMETNHDLYEASRNYNTIRQIWGESHKQSGTWRIKLISRTLLIQPIMALGLIITASYAVERCGLRISIVWKALAPDHYQLSQGYS